MSDLNRNAAGLPESVWERIDASALEAASEVLTGRRFLDLDGPYGIGLTSLEIGPEARVDADDDVDLAATIGSRALPVPMVQRAFHLSRRRVEGHLGLGLPLDLRAAEDAAEAVARREEHIIYQGVPELGLEGLLTAKGRASANCGDWVQVEQAIDDVLGAVNQLDANGFGGPYALALSPARYNALFRRYQGSDMLQVDHLRRLCEAGVYKAAINGAVLVDPRVGELKLGQDLRVGFAASDGIHLQLFISESLVFLLDDPQAICTLEETS
ncbi:MULTISPECIES: family 1 encapsulin nanocompartment shell protein [Thiorhodovibrio]|uniref:family 1 encapsulin nanocompartment shell protein n=1 Tax=Thiorhodovibrio TaxID=61593 RepID=UPI001913A237|nr:MULTISPECIES: family 1 encapsulin nanocompartment shell protein [Thiorhodovibrio]MBK5969124.1 bacteriocin [Thiorhodovibrio winogradskyi]WPL13403.1 Maritimacin [Thiorhodovibrio litoralis]